jgi:translation initiation factor 4E
MAALPDISEDAAVDVASPVVGASKDAAVPDPSNFAIKHPLHNKWTLWFDNPKLKKQDESWEDCLKNIMSFDSVEDFWCLYSNIMPASRLQSGSNYSVFKHGVKPMWEVSTNLGSMYSSW